MKILKSINSLYIMSILMVINLSAVAKNQMGFDLALGTVVDVANEIIYVSHPEKGIDAISIDSGKVVWHSDEASRPVLLRDEQIIAQSTALSKGVVELVSFDATTGAVLSKKTLNAPSKILAITSEGLEHKFEIKANYDTNPLGDIDWSYSYKVAQGIVPEKDSPLTLKDNKTYGKIKFSQSKMESGLSVIESATLKTLPQDPEVKPFAVSGKFLQQDEGRQFISMSRKHVLVSQLNNVLSTWEKYKWSIYDTKDKLLGSFLHHNSYRPFEVVGDTVLFVTSPAMNAEGKEVIRYPFMLNAFSLSNGTQKWTHEVKDLKYNGPYPH